MLYASHEQAFTWAPPFCPYGWPPSFSIASSYIHLLQYLALRQRRYFWAFDFIELTPSCARNLSLVKDRRGLTGCRMPSYDIGRIGRGRRGRPFTAREIAPPEMADIFRIGRSLYRAGTMTTRRAEAEDEVLDTFSGRAIASAIIYSCNKGSRARLLPILSSAITTSFLKPPSLDALISHVLSTPVGSSSAGCIGPPRDNALSEGSCAPTCARVA